MQVPFTRDTAEINSRCLAQPKIILIFILKLE